MDEIEATVSAIVSSCKANGVPVSETPAAFVARTVVNENLTQFRMDKDMTEEDRLELVRLATERLLERDSPSLETVKMQVSFDTAYVEQEALLEKTKGAKDAQLKDGFNCVGFSQGNSLCRGYIQKYNGVGAYPAVQNWLSVHGTVSGVAGFPNCDPDGLLGPVCKPLAHLVGDIAYTAATQKILFQIDYYRDPNRVGTAARSNAHLGKGPRSAPAPPQGAWWHCAARHSH